MSFYSSQVGKKSSRYCDSSLYGNNLSSVYADGPPPLDDSTQDEDDDEMVFKSTNREKLSRKHEHVDNEIVNQNNVEPWSSSTQNSNDTSNDDFGDFSSFADFSSAFGSTKDPKTQSQSPWFNKNSNGDCDQSSETSFNMNSKPEDVKGFVNSDDDDFGCFSGGDESDFENFKGISEGSEILNRGNVSNGFRNEVSSQENNKKSQSQHATNQNNILKSDLFSDDDDDELNDFQSQDQPTENSATHQQTNSNKQISNSLQSAEIPSTFSDDDGLDAFGDFSSTNVTSLNYDSNVTSSTTAKQNDAVSQNNNANVFRNENDFSLSKSKDESNDKQETTIDQSYNSSSKLTQNIRTENASGDVDSETKQDLPQSNLSDKQLDSDHQTSSKSETTSHDTCSISGSNDDDFGDFSTNVDTNSKDNNGDGEFEKVGSNTSNELSISQNSETLDKSAHPENNKDNDNDFGEFSHVTDPHTKENSENNGGEKSSSSLSPSDDDFGDFSAVSEAHTCTNENRNDDDEKSVTISPNDDDDNFGDFSSNEQLNHNTNNETFEKTYTDSQKNQDNVGGFSTDSIKSATISFNSSSKTNSDDDSKIESENSGQTSQNNKSTFSNLNSGTEQDQDEDFGDFSVVSKPANHKQKNNFCEFSTTSQPDPIEPSNKTSNDDDDFGDFAAVESTKSMSEENQQQDSGFGNFATLSNSDDKKAGKSTSNDDDDDDFGDFGKASNDGGDFGEFRQPSNKPRNDDDDDFGKFGQPSDEDDFGDFGEPSNNDEFGDFGEPSNNFGKVGQHSTIKPKFDDNDDFGEFGKPSSIKPNHDIDDDSGDFSEGSTSNNKGLTHFTTSSETGFSNSSTTTKISDTFGSFSSMNQSSQSFLQSSCQSQSSLQSSCQSQSSTSTTTSKDRQNITSSMKMGLIFQPQKSSSITVINNLIKQGFANVQSSVQGNIVTVMLQHELQSGKPSVWEGIKGAERDGSLRFEWVASDHKLQMLESLSMLPVRIQTSASFKSSAGPVQTPLFASGLGLLEPTKGLITPFSHGLEEINPSQDPFGAPPEVGIPDLGFGSNGNGGKKDTLAEVKDNSDTVSVSSSLDLDFLAPSGSIGDLTKTEGKALYEDDLLGLGMQFSASNESPKVFNSGKDQKKIFKFNTTTVSLPSDDKNLSEAAKKVVNDFEDLSFMLSKVLMFPLKSKE